MNVVHALNTAKTVVKGSPADFSNEMHTSLITYELWILVIFTTPNL